MDAFGANRKLATAAEHIVERQKSGHHAPPGHGGLPVHLERTKCWLQGSGVIGNRYYLDM